MKDKAIVLLSGGLDSTTTLYLAKKKYKCLCLIVDYGQRHKKEIRLAKKVSEKAKCDFRIIKVMLPWGCSSLIDKSKKIPYHRSANIGKRIPSTYVPGRNTVFLSYALSFAESIKAKKIFIGANSLDYSGYPDCRPEYFDNLNKVFKVGTINRNIRIEAPLIYKTKKEIVELGIKYKVPFGLTWSCYSGGKHPCGKCDSCLLRAKGFKEAKEKDPIYDRQNF